MSHRAPFSLMSLAWLNVALHVAGLAFAAVGMRPGTPLVALPERLAYLAGSPWGWSLGWATWMLCALALVAFFATLARHLPGEPVAARLAVVFAAAGAGVDLLCDVLYISVLPMIASWGPAEERLFLTVERVAAAGGLVVANGLYSAGTLLLAWCLRDLPTRAAGAVGLGYAVFASGMVLVAAGFLDAPRLAQVATGPTISLFCVWAVQAGRSAGSREDGR